MFKDYSLLSFVYYLSRCKTTYCSRECQANDWKKGHKGECKAIALRGTGVEVKRVGFTGSKKDHRKMDKQADNIIRAAGEIFMDRTGLLLQWSVVNNVNVLDVVVEINFCKAPPSFEMAKSSDYLRDKEGTNLHGMIKKAITENRAEGSVTGLFITVPAAGSEDGSLALMTHGFLGENLICGSWEVAQRQHRQAMLQQGWHANLPYSIGGFNR